MTAGFIYDIRKWFWKHSSTGKIYSSEKHGYIDSEDDEKFQAFLSMKGCVDSFPVDSTDERNESEEVLKEMLGEAGIEMFKGKD